MVAKIITGKSIKGALNYNEKKVKTGNAEQLCAHLFPSENLSFEAKVKWFQHLTEQNSRTKVNTVHISLNFDPTEKLSEETLLEIAEEYMKGIGFEDQPYVLYEHLDAAHQHLHLVTTNIKDGGERISLHHLGKEKSETARKEIEKRFGLVRAESKKQKQQSTKETIKPALKKVIYGKSETKSAVTDVVKSVVADYKFSSLAELNAALNLYNVTAYRGEENSAMYQNKGLVYSVTDDRGNGIGIPIKASSISSRPTLHNLEKKFVANKFQREIYKEPLQRTIDNIINNGFIPNNDGLKNALKKQNIDIVYRQNETMVYGITYIDHRSKTVFNGSDLGKEYSAKRIMERIGISGLSEQKQRKDNKEFVERLLKETDYTKGISHSLGSLYARGLRINTGINGYGETIYSFGKNSNNENAYYQADRKLTAWLVNNDITRSLIKRLNDTIKNHAVTGDKTENTETTIINRTINSVQKHLVDVINILLAEDRSAPTIGPEPQERKKKRRRPNW